MLFEGVPVPVLMGVVVSCLLVALRIAEDEFKYVHLNYNANMFD